MFKFLITRLFPKYTGKHHKTVRYAFSVMFVLTIAVGLAAVVSSNSSYVKIVPSKTSLSNEEQFFIDVSAYAHVPINAVNITIDYPQQSMEVTGIDTGTSVITLWTEEPYAQNGKVYLSGGTFNQGFIGEHTIARIRAKAIEAGTTRVLVEDSQFVAGDGNGTVIATTESDDGSVLITVSGTNDGVISANVEVNIITDTDGDGDVDLADISIFMAAWFKKDKTYDFNGDGRMTFIDFSILLAESFFN